MNLAQYILAPSGRHLPLSFFGQIHVATDPEQQEQDEEDEEEQMWIENYEEQQRISELDMDRCCRLEDALHPSQFELQRRREAALCNMDLLEQQHIARQVLAAQYAASQVQAIQGPVALTQLTPRGHGRVAASFSPAKKQG
jgi:hypothetical protein